MRDDEEIIPLQLTPTAGIAISKFDKINWSFELVVLRDRLELCLARVDSNKRAGTNHRIHRHVVHTDVAVRNPYWLTTVGLNKGSMHSLSYVYRQKRR